ncbi:hypothetical protein NDU88_007316 [Pleurodeles waltl]|uniref:Uncharacterized protein n=1 Tax=Pleurodeles waltl TaxID=8319 RepID=A0AAV7PPV3_PLEWA|nr:hypothetical protein NDU88_007316 [Pleurodeles waltl]
MFIRFLRQPDSEHDLLRVSRDTRSEFLPLLDTASKGEESRVTSQARELAHWLQRKKCLFEHSLGLEGQEGFARIPTFILEDEED